MLGRPWGMPVERRSTSATAYGIGLLWKRLSGPRGILCCRAATCLTAVKASTASRRPLEGAGKGQQRQPLRRVRRPAGGSSGSEAPKSLRNARRLQEASEAAGAGLSGPLPVEAADRCGNAIAVRFVTGEMLRRAPLSRRLSRRLVAILRRVATTVQPPFNHRSDTLAQQAPSVLGRSIR